VALGAFAGDVAKEQLMAFDRAFPGNYLIGLVCCLIRRWTAKYLDGTISIEETCNSSTVILGLELLPCALTAAVQAKLACSNPDDKFAVLKELTDLAYWCMSHGSAANPSLMVRW